MKAPPWTPEMDEQLKQLRIDGLSFAEIGVAQDGSETVTSLLEDLLPMSNKQQVWTGCRA